MGLGFEICTPPLRKSEMFEGEREREKERQRQRERERARARARKGRWGRGTAPSPCGRPSFCFQSRSLGATFFGVRDYRDTSLATKTHPHQDHHRSIGKGLLYVPRGAEFL